MTVIIAECLLTINYFSIEGHHEAKFAVQVKASSHETKNL